MKKKIRNLLCSIIGGLIILSGYTTRMKRKALNGEFILSIYFHSPSKSLFEFCIKWLIKNGFTFISQEDVLAVAQNKKAFPKGAVLITVDDGWQTNQNNIVAVAQQYNVPVTIYIATEPVESGNFWWSYIQKANEMKVTGHDIASLKKVPNNERKKIVQEIQKTIKLHRQALTIDQVKDIAKTDLVTIGAHTVTHPILINCSDVEVKDELKKSKEVLEGWINTSIATFAYPNGDYSEREINYLKKFGYSLAYTTKPLPLTKQAIQNQYELPRFNVFEGVSKNEAICRMLGIWQKIF